MFVGKFYFLDLRKFQGLNVTDVQGFLDFSKQRFGFSLIYLNGELALACNTYAGKKHLPCYYDCYLVYLIASLILELATMNPLE